MGYGADQPQNTSTSTLTNINIPHMYVNQWYEKRYFTEYLGIT
jgi:hypothetical protein